VCYATVRCKIVGTGRLPEDRLLVPHSSGSIGQRNSERSDDRRRVFNSSDCCLPSGEHELLSMKDSTPGLDNHACVVPSVFNYRRPSHL